MENIPTNEILIGLVLITIILLLTIFIIPLLFVMVINPLKDIAEQWVKPIGEFIGAFRDFINQDRKNLNRTFNLLLDFGLLTFGQWGVYKILLGKHHRGRLSCMTNLP